MRSEYGVLIGLVRAALGESPPPYKSSEPTGWDWPFLLATARAHRLSALLLQGLRSALLESTVPESVRLSLRTDYYTNLIHNVILLEHADSLMKAYEKRGAPLALLKGAALARWLYPNPALRSMADMDILVRREDLGLALDVAQTIGYQRLETADHAVLLRHSKSTTYLEIHTGLVSSPGYLRADTDAMLARRIALPDWPGAHTLAPEDHLLHLALHASFQHTFQQPAVNACDAYLVSRLPGLNWEVFFEQASSPRLAPLVYGAVGVFCNVFPNPQMEHALARLEACVRPRHRKRLAHLDIQRLLAPGREATAGPPWRRFLWTPGLQDVLALARETLRPPAKASHFWSCSALGRGPGLAYRHLVQPMRRMGSRAFAGMRS